MPRKPKEPDPRHNAFFAVAYESYRGKHGKIPHWNGKDHAQLTILLANDKTLDEGEFSMRWSEFLTTCDPFHQKQGCSLAYFCANFDKFIPAEWGS